MYFKNIKWVGLKKKLGQHQKLLATPLQTNKHIIKISRFCFNNELTFRSIFIQIKKLIP